MILTIFIPIEGKILLKSGQKVDFKTPLSEEKKGEEVKIFLSQQLQIPPDKIFDYLKKFVGDQIKKGDLLAIKKSFFEDKKVLSEVDGLLKEINHKEGYVLIDSTVQEEKISYCYFTGEVSSVEKNQIKLKVDKMKQYPLKELTDVENNFGGEVFYFREKQDNFTEEEIDGKVIISLSLSSYQRTKLEALGAKALITLHRLNHSAIPSAIFKNIDDNKEVLSEKLSYCLIERKESKIIFYS